MPEMPPLTGPGIRERTSAAVAANAHDRGGVLLIGFRQDPLRSGESLAP